ncbi:MAG: hypothetical protein QME68_05710, partial [Elusimicrobiota bacterium]|nr:hypothetical protein [Elusimicrobiota bacterium]
MGFFDFLKGILPDSIIKIIDKSDNRKIEIKNSVVIIGKNKFDDKKTVDLFFDKIHELKREESLPFQLIHKDLVDDFIEYEDISIRDKSNLKLLKEVLPSEEVECILMARRIV